MKRISQFIVAATVLAASSLAQAGVYTFIDIGQAAKDSKLDYHRIDKGATGLLHTEKFDSSNDLQYNIGLGFNFNEHIGLELSYNNYDGVEGFNSGLGLATDITYLHSLGLGAVLSAPVGDNFAVYLKGGMEVWAAGVESRSATVYANETYNGYGHFYGFGFKMDMTEHLSLRNEFLWRELEDNGLKVEIRNITLGLVYEF